MLELRYKRSCEIPVYAVVGTWSAEMSGRYPGVMISNNKLSVRVSPICLSELVAIVRDGGKKWGSL